MISGYPIYDICTLSENRENDMLVDRFAAYLQSHTNLRFPHKHSFYHLVFFTEASGTHSIDFRTYDARAGQIYFMAPGQVHSWFFGEQIDGYIVNFSPAYFNNFLLRADYPESLPFFSGNIDDCVFDLDEESAAEIARLFEQLITETQQAAASGYNQTLLSNFRKLIEQNYAALKLPKEYAALLYITPNHLNAICTDILGISAGEVIRSRVMLEAKRMLVNPKLTVADIAGRLGFADNSYFTRFFKKQAGLPPEEFRKTVNSK
jgi:AraC family transcriptional regulator, transcriptional activator of pobA